MTKSFFRRLALLMAATLVSMPVFTQLDPAILVNQVISNRAAFESESYNVLFKIKKFSRPDTLEYSGNVELVRKTDDTVFNGLILIDLDTIWYGYDGEKIFSRNFKTKEVLYDNALTSPGLFIKSTLYNNLIDDGFLKISTGLQTVITDPAYHAQFTDVEMGGRTCLGIHFTTPDQDEFSNYRYFVIIDPDSACIKKITYSVYFQGNEQYQEWNYSNIQCGHDTTLHRLDWKTYGGDYKETHYVPDNRYNSEIPDFEWSTIRGKLYNSDQQMDIRKVDADFIVLDFWYSSCYPCIKSIPAVREISNKYKSNEVRVFGVNMIDDEEKDLFRLQKFYDHNPMPYPTIMLDHSYNQKLPLAFPTFLILNSRYEVVFQETGYNENLFEEVTRFLDDQLNY